MTNKFMLEYIRWGDAANITPKDHFDQLKIRTTNSKISMIKVITLMKSSIDFSCLAASFIGGREIGGLYFYT